MRHDTAVILGSLTHWPRIKCASPRLAQTQTSSATGYLLTSSRVLINSSVIRCAVDGWPVSKLSVAALMAGFRNWTPLAKRRYGITTGLSKNPQTFASLGVGGDCFHGCDGGCAGSDRVSNLVCVSKCAVVRSGRDSPDAAVVYARIRRGGRTYSTRTPMGSVSGTRGDCLGAGACLLGSV